MHESVFVFMLSQAYTMAATVAAAVTIFDGKRTNYDMTDVPNVEYNGCDCTVSFSVGVGLFHASLFSIKWNVSIESTKYYVRQWIFFSGMGCYMQSTFYVIVTNECECLDIAWRFWSLVYPWNSLCGVPVDLCCRRRRRRRCRRVSLIYSFVYQTCVILFALIIVIWLFDKMFTRKLAPEASS